MKAEKFTGLTSAQVVESRRLHGVNVITPPAKEPLWRLYLEKFEDPIIRILLIALLASVAISIVEWYETDNFNVFLEPVGIFIAVVLATLIGFIFEVKANRAFDVLNQTNDDTLVQTLRDGNFCQVPQRDIVVGDVVFLNEGDKIPADGQLLQSVSLQVNESMLTGEQVANKSVRPEDFDEHATYPTNIVLRGTVVVGGHGAMRVERVGDATEDGKVFVSAQIDSSVKTPLNMQLDRLGMLITRMSYILASLVFAGRLVSWFLENEATFGLEFWAYVMQTVMIALTLIVVSVPEGLPMSVTLSLALSMRRMLRTNNLVRRMHACETMGACNVICTDKTGTLTQNRMSVAQTIFFDTSQQAERIVAEGIATNSTAHLDQSDPTSPKPIGNPTEGALLMWLKARGTDYETLRLSVLPEQQIAFSTERKFMATVVRSAALSNKRVLHVKGAPEVVLAMSQSIAGGKTRADVEQALTALQARAMRTLAFAYCELSESEEVVLGTEDALQRLTFLGIVGIADPVRPEVPLAVAECGKAGIDIKIVTGDNSATAREIATQIGLWTAADGDDNEITGTEFEQLSDDELTERAPALKIISRARPLDKRRLVEALQRGGKVVAVTGDGTNDAPALKAAQVGLSMGDGTSVAKEASDITILDNSFSSISRAVMWGRSLYRNIQRFLLFQMTINVVACLVVLLGAFIGTQSPLTVTQMLWVNLIMDTFAAMALASLPPSLSVMHEAPRQQSAPIILPSMWRRIVGVGLLFTAVLIAMLYLLRHYNLTAEGGGLLSLCSSAVLKPTGHHLLSDYEESLFFTMFVMLQFWNLFNVRAFLSNHTAMHRIGQCRGLLLIALLIFVGQVVIVTFGGRFFNVTPLLASDWIVIVIVSSLVLWIGEAHRAVKGLINTTK